MGVVAGRALDTDVRARIGRTASEGRHAAPGTTEETYARRPRVRNKLALFDIGACRNAVIGARAAIKWVGNANGVRPAQVSALTHVVLVQVASDVKEIRLGRPDAAELGAAGPGRAIVPGNVADGDRAVVAAQTELGWTGPCLEIGR